MKVSKLATVVLLLCFIFWPLGLYLHNQSSELLTFVVPAILLFVIYKAKLNSALTFILLILISVFVPKLALFPLLFITLAAFKKEIKGTKKFLFLGATVITLIALWGSFKGQTVFVSDYEAQQKVIRDQQLYPHPYLARTFHNKARVVLDKVNNNLFAMTDPNNYFFGFAPRQIVENQNIQKFPFLALPFFLLGLYYLTESRDKNFIIVSAFAGIIALSFVNNFDKNDFILSLPLFLIILNGVNVFEKKLPQYKNAAYILFIAFSSIELIRILL